MPGTTGAGSTLLARPTVLRTFAGALVGRLAYGVLPLSFLFTVRQATASFAVAATAAAVLGVGTLAMPVQARALDRWGQRRVLPVLTGTWIGLLTTAVVLAVGDVGIPAVWWALAAPLGTCAPALGPSMRAQWRWFTEGTELRRTAYSIDAVAEECLYLLGPVVAAAALTLGPARWGLALVAALAAIGTASLALSPGAAARADTPGRWLSMGPARRTGMPRLLASMACFGVGSALVYTGVASAADRVGQPGWAGLVEAGISGGSVVGGLLWARTPRPLPDVPLLLAVLAALLLAAAALPFAAAGALLAVGGVAIAPTFVSAYQAADRLAPDHERTEASSLVNTATNLAMALGTAFTGAAVAAGVSPYVVAAVAVALAAPLARGRGGTG